MQPWFTATKLLLMCDGVSWKITGCACTSNGFQQLWVHNIVIVKEENVTSLIVNEFFLTYTYKKTFLGIRGNFN